MGIFLWVIGYMLAMIFGDNRTAATLSLVIFICTIMENLIIKKSKDVGLNKYLY